MSQAAPDGGAQEPTTAATRAADLELSVFQLRLLSIIRDRDGEYGLGIKRAVEAYHGREVNHGRLYQNLNRLAEDGLVAKNVLDGRTNLYTLTEAGRETLVEEIDQLAGLADYQPTVEPSEPAESVEPSEPAESVEPSEPADREDR